jgi:hypothetical protein
MSVSSTIYPSSTAASTADTQAHVSPICGPSFCHRAVKQLLSAIPPKYDRSVFGFGVDGGPGKKWTPVPANPETAAPRCYNPKTKRYEPYTFGSFRALQHVTGERPAFLIPQANRRVQQWDMLGLHNLIEAAIHHEAGIWEDDPSDVASAKHDAVYDRLAVDAVDEFVNAMMAPRSRQQPLSINRVNDLLRGKPGKVSYTGMTVRDVLGRYLLACPNKLTWKLVDRAIRTTLEPISELLIGIDIDSKPEYRCGPGHALELARRCIDEILRPAGIEAFVEPSRSRTGAYIWIRIYSEGKSADQINAALASLFKRLTEVKHDDLVAHVCKISKIAEWQDNPAYNESLYHARQWDDAEDEVMLNGERYEWQKAHSGMTNKEGEKITWNYSPSLEPYVLTGSDFLTMPLHGIAQDPDRGRDRLARFSTFMKSPAITASHLREFLSNVDGVPATTATSTLVPPKTKGKKNKRKAPTTSSASAESGYQTAEDIRAAYPECRDLEILLDTSVGEHHRFGAAVRMAIRRHKGDENAAYHEAMALVEAGGATGEIGPATGPTTDERKNHAGRCISHWTTTYDPAVCAAKPLFGEGEDKKRNLEWLEARVRSHFPRHLLQAIQHKSRKTMEITYPLMTAAVAYMLHGIHSGRIAEVSRDFLLRCLSNDGLLAPTDTHTAARLIRMLTDGQYGWFRITRWKAIGHCCRYELRRACPIPTWLAQNDQVKVVIHEGFYVWNGDKVCALTLQKNASHDNGCASHSEPGQQGGWAGRVAGLTPPPGRTIGDTSLTCPYDAAYPNSPSSPYSAIFGTLTMRKVA